MSAYATLEELQDRLDWELDEIEERVAESSLEDASDLARFYGRDWTVAPRMVRTLVLKAVVRYLKNYHGYTQSRAGDETVAWSDASGIDLGTIHFTKPEIKIIESLADNRGKLISAPVNAWGTKVDDYDNGWRPTDRGKDFPMYQLGGEPL